MTREECNLMAKKFADNFSKYAGKSKEFYADLVDRIEEKFRRYEFTDVDAGLKSWLNSNSLPPTFDQLEIETQKAKTKFKEVSQEEFDTPTTWSHYVEDDEGCGYAVNSKTGEYDCIWKYWWKKDKVKTLREHGVSYEELGTTV